jgi:hypothetical protein
MPRASTIKTHARREDIERDIAQGVPAVEISQRYGVSPSAVARHKSNRIDALAAVLDDESPAPDDLLSRLRELADSTRQARKLADASGSPATRARAASSELAVLDRLLDRAGITDMTAVDLTTATGALVRVVQSYVLDHPEHAPELFSLMGKHPELIDARDTLRAQLKEQKKK